jgi:hypothetical protein
VRIFARILGWLAILVAAGAGGMMLAAITSGQSPAQPLGQLWFAVDPGSLNAFQAIVERYLWPPLWDFIVFPVLRQETTLVALIALVVGLVLLIVARRRNGRKRRLFKS